MTRVDRCRISLLTSEATHVDLRWQRMRCAITRHFQVYAMHARMRENGLASVHSIVPERRHVST